MDMNQLVAMQQSVTFLGQIGGMALALLGAGLAVGLSCVGSAKALMKVAISFAITLKTPSRISVPKARPWPVCRRGRGPL